MHLILIIFILFLIFSQTLPSPNLKLGEFYILIHFLKISLIYIFISEAYVILDVWPSIEVC